MASLRHNLIYLLLALILVLALSACVRPFGQSEAEQAEQATQEAEAQAADQAEEEPQAEEETTEAVEPESEAEETAPEETEAEDAEEGEESEEAVSSDPDVGGGAPETEEEAPAAEETPPAEEEAAAEEVVEGEAEMSEETAAEDVAAEDAAEEAPAEEEAAAEEEAVEEAAAEEEMAEEAEAEEPVTTTLPATHTVAPGENLFRIGLKYGMSWIPLAVYNDISNPNIIYTGQVLRIPGGQAPPTESAPEEATYTNYTVKPGDTVYKISRAFGVSAQEIVEANGLVNPNLIYAGQVLKIPTG